MMVAAETEVGSAVHATGTEKWVESTTVTTKVPLIVGENVPPVTPAIVTESPVASAVSRVVITTHEGLPKAMLPMMVLDVVPKSMTGSMRVISGVPAKMPVWVGE